MNKAEAILILEEAFNGSYSAESFTRFITNLFKGEYTPLDKRRDGQYVREAFRAFVQSYRIIGTYKDAEGTSLDIIEVLLQRESSLERARTAQRNFIADYLKNNDRDAALVAFISPHLDDWRFSLVKLEYSLDTKDGKITTEEEITPARRWSFLIGQHEGSHTVQSRFVLLLQDIEKPQLKELEEAFNIESVTDEFFKKYCELFFKMKESLDRLINNDVAIKADFESKELTTIDFAKKNLGQMAFLYFLQKKGWFGVAPSKPWGTGPKDFLRQLFTRRENYGSNFFDDVLEPLFYEALAQDRGVEAIYPRLNNCRMPFLNGGLFEPMNGYSWETTNIRLPDDLFSNKNKTPEGDEGDGILDIFDRYNFTVNESEPLEKEVAVDPEMLGKVFENLLEVKDRKSKGTFYTPREIVHFMCQECLINYLKSELKESISREDLEILIKNGSQIIQNDAMVLEKGNENTYKFMLPESIRMRANDLDQALINIKVCDPAVGSGAFPLGMLNEIVQARQALSVHIRTERSIFDLKLHSISHSLYGVDIDPGAVEIAKLRLWLALVVEEKEPHPLPNLEHKIMQGNSLISEYEGIKLFDQTFLETANYLEKESSQIDERLSQLQRKYFKLHNQEALSSVLKEELEREIRALSKKKKLLNTPANQSVTELSIFDAPGRYQQEQVKADQLQKKITSYVSESQKSKKQKLKEEIEQLKWELIEASFREQGKLEKLKNIEALRRKNIKPFFVWKLEFSDVFADNGGFDVVIGNPPYVDSEQMVREDASLRRSYKEIYQSAVGNWDLFVIFIELAINLCARGGMQSFIVPNKLVGADYASEIRTIISRENSLRVLRDYSNVKVFKEADVYPCVYILKASKGIDSENVIFQTMMNSQNITRTISVSNIDLVKDLLWDKHFASSENSGVLKKMSRFTRLQTSKFNVENSATVSEAYKLKEVLIDCETPSGGMKFVNTGTIDRYTFKWGIKNTRYIKDAYKFPRAPISFLSPKRKLQATGSKLIIAGMTKVLEVAFDISGDYIPGKSTIFIHVESQEDGWALLALLNSKLITFWYNIEFSSLSLAGGYLRINKNCILQIPIPDDFPRFSRSVSSLSMQLGEAINDKASNAKIAKLEEMVDQCVFDAFDILPEEILSVEAALK